MLFKLLLLAVVAGNLALVTVNLDVFAEIEAVAEAEWRIDQDPGDSGTDPQIPALLGLFPVSMVVVTGQDVLSGYPGLVDVVRMRTPVSRAPPSA